MKAIRAPRESAVVRNRKGRPSLFVYALSGGRVVIQDAEGRTVTALVLRALRAWHEKARREAGLVVRVTGQ